jgi:hypothetical protein
VIASQIVLLDRGSYRLRYRLESSGIGATSPLRWAILDPQSGMIMSRSAHDVSDTANTGWLFDVNGLDGVGATPLRLALLYERLPTAPRETGWVRIDAVSLDTVR